MGLRVLFLSNGHGEDAIGALLARELEATGAPVDITAFPLVGTGGAYTSSGIPVAGVQGVLPSGGFARLGWRQFWGDARAGLVGLLVRQARALRRMGSRFDAAVAIGDALPLVLAAWFVRRPLAFYSTAKSEYIQGHLAVEAWLMRRHCRKVFTRDARTARALAGRGVPATFCGNLMMDMVGPGQDVDLPVPREAALVVLLPGSREDAYGNLADMLEAVAVLAGPATGGGGGPEAADPPAWAFAVALAPSLPVDKVGAEAGPLGWELELREGPAAPGAAARAGLRQGPEVIGRLKRGGVSVWLVVRGFSALLHRARACIGTAGTANEQAVGLGIPVVAFPGRGWQFTPRFLAAQKRLLGDGLLAVPRTPSAVAEAVRRAVQDEGLRARVREAGRERMGTAGGAARMARELLALWGLEPSPSGGAGADGGAGGGTGSPEASVVIPAYNNRAVLEKVLQSLCRQTFPSGRFEVVVVDDGSTDGTGAMVQNFKAPFTLRYVGQPNRGRSAARNRGIEAARAELIIFLDSDIVVEEGFVAAHVEAHREAWAQGRRLVVNGPVIYTENFDDPASEKPRWTDMSRAFFATGNASVRRQDLLDAGLFDEDFREYGWEDLELGDRLRDLGLKSTTAPGARGYHLQVPVRVDTLPARLEKERQRGRSALLYYRKRPTFQVRAKLQLLWPFFALDRVMTLGGRLAGEGMWERLRRWEAAGRSRRVRFWSKVLMQHAYMEGLREGLRGAAGPAPAKPAK